MCVRSHDTNIHIERTICSESQGTYMYNAGITSTYFSIIVRRVSDILYCAGYGKEVLSAIPNEGVSLGYDLPPLP